MYRIRTSNTCSRRTWTNTCARAVCGKVDIGSPSESTLKQGSRASPDSISAKNTLRWPHVAGAERKERTRYESDREGSVCADRATSQTGQTDRGEHPTR